MHFYDVAFRVMKEDLVPFLGKGSAIVRVVNSPVVQECFERVNVVSPERDMTALNRIDDLLVLKSDVQILFRQMHLDLTIRRKSNIAAIPFLVRCLRSRKILNGNVSQAKNLGVEPMQPSNVFRNVIDMMEFEFHTNGTKGMSQAARDRRLKK